MVPDGRGARTGVRVARSHRAQHPRPATREPGRDVRVARQPRCRRLRGRAVERAPAGEALDEHEPEGVDVGRRPHLASLELLGRDVRHRADGLVGSGDPRAAEEAGDAEVGQPDRAVVVEHEVRRLHVAMHDALAVDVVERGGGLAADAGHPVERECAAVQQLAHGRPAEQLEDEEGVAVVGSGVEETNEVRVLEPGERPGLCGEATFMLDLAEHLHRHIALEAHVPAPVHVGHAAAVDEVVDAVSGLEDGVGGDHRTPWHLPSGRAD